MENTNENKAKFFAQYLGQSLVLYHNDKRIKRADIINWVSFNSDYSNYYLHLTPLSQITDEHAIELMKIQIMSWVNLEVSPIILRSTKNDITVGHSFYELNIHFLTGEINFISETDNTTQSASIHCIDYLRSKGYALPWMGLSVEQLVSFGWIKLKGGNQ